ncbi:MAG: metalloprotease TldD [Pseudomonadota bacterium]
MTSSTTSRFDPFGEALGRDAAQARLSDALSGADDGELFLERRRSEALMFDDGRLKNASFDASEGFGVRVVKGEAVGYAHSPELSEAALGRACETARLAARGGGGRMAPPPAATNQKLYGDANPIEDAPFKAKVETCREIDAWTRALDPRVRQVTVSMAGGLQEVAILRADGALVTDARPMTRVNVSVMVEENGRRETGSSGAGGRLGFHGWLSETGAEEGFRDLAREALRQALVNLEAEEAPAGVMEVALGPGWCGVLLHEAVGHGLEGDFNRKKTSAFAGLMGEMVAAKGVTVVDEGALADKRGSITVDDEGTPSGRAVLIEDGRLTGYMQDRLNARLMGQAPTGNGRRQSYAHAPMPRMTNTYMLGGDAAPEEVVAAVKDGIYAKSFSGGQVDITNGKFVFNCTEAYRVRDGKIAHPVKGATLIGDGPSALKRVRMIGSDMALDPGIGVCGKNGQGVPVTVGQPTILIDGLTVGGRGA